MKAMTEEMYKAWCERLGICRTKGHLLLGRNHTQKWKKIGYPPYMLLTCAMAELVLRGETPLWDKCVDYVEANQADYEDFLQDMRRRTRERYQRIKAADDAQRVSSVDHAQRGTGRHRLRPRVERQTAG